VIAVPALVYAVGAYGFFALPYTIIVYPFVFAVMPVLWKQAHANGHVTAADVVHGNTNSRGLELAVAITGMVATMPYIALQLIGMGVVIKAMGLTGELPIVAAFIILALYTYSSGLRAPADRLCQGHHDLISWCWSRSWWCQRNLAAIARCSPPPTRHSRSRAARPD
jgi:SSS family solute:Na+ symporter